MVSPNPTSNEATRAAFRFYAISSALTPDFEALATRLGLVDVRTSSIRCQGRCRNGGRCSQRIDQHAVARGVLRLQTVAVDGRVVGEGLEEALEGVYEGLLCGSAGHCCPEQVARCAFWAKGVVEVWRGEWGVGSGVMEEDGDCKRCVKIQCELDDADARLSELADERDELEEEVAALTFERDDAVAKVDKLETKCEEMSDSRDEANERAEEVARLLQTLQIKHDGLMGRMAVEVDQHQRKASSVERGSRSSAPSSKSSAFKDVEEDQAPDSGYASSRSRKERVTDRRIQPATPSSRTLSPSPSMPSDRTSLASSRKVGSPTPKSLFARKTSIDSTPTPPTADQPNPFAHIRSPASSNPARGILGIGNIKPVGHPQSTRPFEPLTPNPTPPKQHQNQNNASARGDLLFRSGPLQPSPHLQHLRPERSAENETTTPLLSRLHRQTAVDSGTPPASKGRDAAAKPPFGFAVRRRGAS